MFIGTRDGWLYKLTNQLEVIDSIYVRSAPSRLVINKDGTHEVLLMGIMDPNDRPAGSLLEIDFRSGKTRKLIDSLKRPVHFEKFDLNQDNLADYVICSFGNITGELAVYENQGNQMFKKHLLNQQPGTRKVFIDDFTADGKLDILALITQADEKVMLFKSQDNFNFKPSTLIRFPSVYGSSDFDVADFNKDGYFDIVTAQGDNADFSIIKKPYHGVRLFLNKGDNSFYEKWFYPLHGASEVKVEDFDGDGDSDLAVISFFPDFKQEPRNSFIYFENRELEFIPYTAQSINKGRWLVMDSNDIDEDGDKDLLMGALNFRPLVPDSTFIKWKTEGTALLVLRNNQKLKKMVDEN